MSVIVIENLTKRYGQRVGIQDLNLCVPEGVIYGFLGPNGAGKSTTIRLLLALLRPSGGRARIFGRDCWRHGHVIKADLGYVPGDLRLHSWMTARRALDLFGRVRRRDLRAYADVLLARFELDPEVKVRRMSRGMRQKLGLILALAHRPRLLVLDEPTSGLDPLMQDQLYAHLRERAADGATVFFSSHTLSEVEGLCDRVAVVREGKLVADERLDDLRKKAAREVTLRWRHPQSADQQPPEFLTVRERRGLEWRCTLTGPVMDLTRWAATQPLEDIAIVPPDLETFFRQFYQQDTLEP